MRTAHEKSSFNLSRLDINTCFLISGRLFDNGVHKKMTSTDVQFNNFILPEKLDYGCEVIQFCSKCEKLNFSTFWYKNPLWDQIVRGIHSSSLTEEIWDLIPHIDWSIERDYENLTIDDLIMILNNSRLK